MKFHIFGPGTQQAVAESVDEALKKASRMVYMPIFRVGSYRLRLEEGKFVDWSYGFDTVRIEPITEQIEHMGRVFTVLAKYPDTEKGRELANAYMNNTEGAALLCIKDGIGYLAHVNDLGTEKKEAA